MARAKLSALFPIQPFLAIRLECWLNTPEPFDLASPGEPFLQFLTSRVEGFHADEDLPPEQGFRLVHFGHIRGAWGPEDETIWPAARVYDQDGRLLHTLLGL